jgi:PAS domain S-box-containing protein
MSAGNIDDVSKLKMRIAELEQAEIKLKESEERFQQLESATFEGVLISLNGVILEANEQFMRMTGYSRDEVIGKNGLELLIAPEYHDLVLEKIRSNSEDPYEIQGRQKDGSLIPLEVRGTSIVFEGEQARVTAIRDISWQKKTEKELRDSEERYKMLVENAPDPIVVYQNGNLIYVNNAAIDFIAAPSREALIGKPILQFVHPESHEIVKERVKFMMQTGLPAPTVEHKYVRMDGKVIFAEISSTPITYEGQPAFQAILRDVTKRKELEGSLREAKENAERATKLKDKFVGLVSHNLKSPFSAITGLLKIVMSDQENQLADDHKSMIGKVLHTCDGLVEVVDKLLDPNRLQSGEISLLKKRLSGHLLAEQRMGTLRPLAEIKGISLRNDLSPEMRVFGDADLLGECLSNLLSNAIKFCNKGCEIIIFRPEGLPTTIAVRDNGVGVSEKLIPNLFNPAVKTFDVGTAGERGTGLGLPFCNDIMEAHGGTITVESEIGNGSTFYLNLPDIKPIVLIVDDDYLVRLMARTYLEELDVDIVEAEDGLKAIEMVAIMSPHVVITDINMPRMNGIDFVKELKRSPKNRHLPIIATTGDEAMKVQGMDVRSYMLQIGCDDFANKPFARVDLVPRVLRLIGI